MLSLDKMFTVKMQLQYSTWKYLKSDTFIWCVLEVSAGTQSYSSVTCLWAAWLLEISSFPFSIVNLCPNVSKYAPVFTKPGKITLLDRPDSCAERSVSLSGDIAGRLSPSPGQLTSFCATPCAIQHSREAVKIMKHCVINTRVVLSESFTSELPIHPFACLTYHFYRSPAVNYESPQVFSVARVGWDHPVMPPTPWCP